MLDLDTILKLSDDIVLRGVSDKWWALNVKNGNQFKLNEVSYFMLDHLRTATPISLMIEAVLEEYNVDREKLVEDCNAALQVAIRNGIVEEVKS